MSSPSQYIADRFPWLTRARAVAGSFGIALLVVFIWSHARLVTDLVIVTAIPGTIGAIVFGLTFWSKGRVQIGRRRSSGPRSLEPRCLCPDGAQMRVALCTGRGRHGPRGRSWRPLGAGTGHTGFRRVRGAFLERRWRVRGRSSFVRSPVIPFQVPHCSRLFSSLHESPPRA